MHNIPEEGPKISPSKLGKKAPTWRSQKGHNLPNAPETFLTRLVIVNMVTLFTNLFSVFPQPWKPFGASSIMDNIVQRMRNNIVGSSILFIFDDNEVTILLNKQCKNNLLDFHVGRRIGTVGAKGRCDNRKKHGMSQGEKEKSHYVKITLS